MDAVFKIAKWTETFERAESRKLKVLTWVAMPVSFNSAGYNAMLEEFEGDAPAIYGAWCALCGFAASCHIRGVLGDSRGNPLKVRHIARVTGFPSEIFARLIGWASRPDVGWIVPATPSDFEEHPSKTVEKTADPIASGESPDDPPASRDNPPNTRPDRTGQDKTEPDRTEPKQNIVRRSIGWASVSDEFFERVRVIAQQMQAMRIPGIESPDIWRIAWVGVDLDRPQLLDTLSRVREGMRDGTVRKPRQYITAAMVKMCERAGEHWDALKMDVPPFRRSPEQQTVGGAA